MTSTATGETAKSAVAPVVVLPVDKTMDRDFARPAANPATSIGGQLQSAGSGKENNADSANINATFRRARLHDEALKSAFSGPAARELARFSVMRNTAVESGNSQNRDSQLNAWDVAIIAYGQRSR